MLKTDLIHAMCKQFQNSKSYNYRVLKKLNPNIFYQSEKEKTVHFVNQGSSTEQTELFPK